MIGILDSKAILRTILKGYWLPVRVRQTGLANGMKLEMFSLSNDCESRPWTMVEMHALA